MRHQKSAQNEEHHNAYRPATNKGQRQRPIERKMRDHDAYGRQTT